MYFNILTDSTGVRHDVGKTQNRLHSCTVLSALQNFVDTAPTVKHGNI